MTLVTGIIGIAMVTTFLGFLVWWIKEISLTLIVAAVMVMLIVDFVQTLRSGDRV
jgi:hypothetical protein